MFTSRVFVLAVCIVIFGVHVTAQNNGTNATVSSPPSEITEHDEIPQNADDVEVGYDLANFNATQICIGNLCEMDTQRKKVSCFAHFHPQVNTEHVASCVEAMCTNETWPEPCYDYDGTERYPYGSSSLGDALRRTYVAASLGLSSSSFSPSSLSLVVVAALAAGAIVAATAITALKNKPSSSSSSFAPYDEKSLLLPGKKTWTKQTTAFTNTTSNLACVGVTAAASCVLATVAIVGFGSGGVAGTTSYHLGVAPRAHAAAAAPRAAAAVSPSSSSTVFFEPHEGLIAPRMPPGGVLVDSKRPALGWKLPRGPPKNVTFLLHTKCVSNTTKTLNPNFWKHKITNAYVAHKSASGMSTDAMFSSKHLLEMHPVTEEMTGYEFGWERGRFVLTTHTVDFEWGFVLQNELGELYYEIGTGGMKDPIDKRFKQRRPIAAKYLKMLHEHKGDSGAYAHKQCPDVVQFGAFYNRLANEESNGTVFKQPVDALGEYVFGQCDQTCEKVPFPLWDAEDRAYESNRTQYFPPTGLGEGFTMYGEAGRGVPILWAFGDWPATPHLGKVLFVFNARDRFNTVVYNTRVSSTNPYNWGPEEYTSWVFGPTGDRSSKFRWRLDYTNMETYYLIEFCTEWIGKASCKVYKKYNYREPRAYEKIKHIDIGSPNNIPYLIPDWSCDFYRRMDQDISRVPANVQVGDTIDWGIP